MLLLLLTQRKKQEGQLLLLLLLDIVAVGMEAFDHINVGLHNFRRTDGRTDGRSE
jgi:hypothetical protein